jgi:NAD(P)-dependent dehydrogenase (short-subunit alcohol dehydrogenase family)
MGYELSGKVALVTGAARGIGLETARRLHARGAAVALVDLDLDAARRAAGAIGADRALGLAADVTDRDALAGAVATTVERFGGIDVCVANAGIAPMAATLRVMDPDVVERVIEVNLLGVWRTVRATLPQVVARRGHITVVASVYAFMNGVLLAPYAIAKAGVEQMGRALRVELREHGASAGVAYFGFIDTDMVRVGLSDPLSNRLNESVPGFMLRRLPPQAAAAAIVRGIERRAPRVILPRWWTALSLLRGALGPGLDRRMERDDRVLGAVREADVEGRVAGREMVPTADQAPTAEQVP